MFRARSAGWHVIPHVSRLPLAAGVTALVAAMVVALGSGCADRRAPGPALHRVVIQGFEFRPAALSIALGDTVEWVNQDLVPHTATAQSGRWTSDSILPGGSWRAVLSTPGSEPYICQLHPIMKARLEVR